MYTLLDVEISSDRVAALGAAVRKIVRLGLVVGDSIYIEFFFLRFDVAWYGLSYFCFECLFILRWVNYYSFVVLVLICFNFSLFYCKMLVILFLEVNFVSVPWMPGIADVFMCWGERRIPLTLLSFAKLVCISMIL